MAKYSIGIDYGTLSGRAVLVEIGTGRELATSVLPYPHGVMDDKLPGDEKNPEGIPLGLDWALEHPQDYLDVIYTTVPAVIKEARVNPADIIGIGIDVTCCTVMPVLADGTPLCFLDEFKANKHAYIKLWKHHAAQDMADKMNELAAERKEEWLANYGGKISSEWSFPKLMQLIKEAPEVYKAMEGWIEAADWVVWQLCGNRTTNVCMATVKALWDEEKGYPLEFLTALDPRLADAAEGLMGNDPKLIGTRAGGLTKEMAEKTGLPEGIAVAVGTSDAHAAPAGCGIDGPGKMLAIIGTSTCHMMLSEKNVAVPGICGNTPNTILPGYIGYEAGQCCVGDHFDWFVSNCCPPEYYKAAEAEGIGIHDYLTKLADMQKPGESGLLALDWWNGNRSILVDADLMGMIIGMTLQTKPEDIYRALIEATAFGTRMIIENYREYGVDVNEFIAGGGISQKNAMMMQIYADVINMPVKVAESKFGSALGAAVSAAVAAGSSAGGYDDIFEAARDMGRISDKVYYPIAENAAVYELLFAEYKKLHDYFGRGGNDVMKRIKAIKESLPKKA